MSPPTKATSEARTPEKIFADLQELLSAVDSLSIADAFRIGSLVREYGQATANQASSNVIAPFIDMIKSDLESKRPPKEPWRKDGG